MKELYTDIEVEVVVFESADVIKTSNAVFGLDNNSGGSYKKHSEEDWLS